MTRRASLLVAVYLLVSVAPGFALLKNNRFAGWSSGSVQHWLESRWKQKGGASTEVFHLSVDVGRR